MIRTLTTALAITLMLAVPATAKQIRFSGYDFKVKEGKGLGPGPNDWATSQVFVDSQGFLHLRFSEKNGKWLAGEVQSVSKLGFGLYEIEYEGDIHGQDKNVVFGFFNYPDASLGPDATHEIDVEFARWGIHNYKPLNYTVWPTVAGAKNAHKVFSFRPRSKISVHRFRWSRNRVVYSSWEVQDDGDKGLTVQWAFKPKTPAKQISKGPMSIYFNLWGFRGQSPSDGKPVEAVIRRFTFTPE